MEQLLLCGVIVLVQLILYWIIGNNLCRWMKTGKNGLETLLIGFFGYFGLFQIIMLPMICLKISFHVPVIIWGIICLLILIKGIVADRRSLWSSLHIMRQELAARKIYFMLAAVGLMLFLMVYQTIHYYTGMDTAFYVGNVNTTVYTDSMYIYNGETGLEETYLNMRYALSCFYMNTAFWCKVSGVSPIIVQNYGMGNLCIFMAVLIMFLIGKHIFPENTDKAYIYAGIIMVMNLFFVSGFTSADFLVYRGYEAKGFCVNVVIPAVFYAILRIWEQAEQQSRWKLLFLIAFASVPVSMSAILIVPAMIGVITLAECLVQKNPRLLWNGIICVLPNAVYLIAYFLYTKGLWLIKI